MKNAVWFSLLICLLSAPAWAGYSLLGDGSTLNFVSIKKGSVAEVHRFERLRGRVGDDGAIEIVIDLASVATNIPIRDERMRTLLFETGKFANATLHGRIDTAGLSRLTAGDKLDRTLKLTLDLHGRQAGIEARISIIALKCGLLVTSRVPVIVNAADFGLVEGIEKLREVAKLPSIATAVPVSFELLFSRDPAARAPALPGWRWSPRR